MVIQRFGIYPFGLILGATLSLGSVFGSAGDGFGQKATANFLGLGAILYIPLLYGTLGLIGGILSAAIYNFGAGLVGGLELEVR